MNNPDIEMHAAKAGLLRTLVAFQIGIVLVVAFAGDRFVSYQYSFDDMSAWPMAKFILAVLLGLVGLVGLFGLWQHWRLARLLFTLSAILSPAVFLLGVPIEMTTTRAGDFFDQAGDLAAGATIALIYFGNMEYYFDQGASE